jgi:Asp-tRNA(Asn)/Glu-tRNA(Gln) amidotransferase A subunit family amidase
VSDPYNAVITPVGPRENPPSRPLSGRTLLVKDLIDVAGVRATYGSRIYADHVPGSTAPAAQRLLDAGAVLVGKANLPEFAWNVTRQNPWYGTVANPALPGRTTGGSSGGNAAGLAAGLCDLGLGTDTGCSIRLPSACCGTVGLKTRWGTITTQGVFPLVPTLDTLGPMARTVEDVALMWSVLTGRPAPEPRLAGLIVGLIRRPPSVGDGTRPAESLAGEMFVGGLEALGARVVPAEIPEPDANTCPVFFHEARRSHHETFPRRADEYSDNVRTKLELALKLDRDEVAEAHRALEAWRRDEPDVDLFVSPCVGIDIPPEECDEFEVSIPFSAFLRPVNLLGWAGLAMGNMQLVAPYDETVLAAGLAWEAAHGPPAPPEPGAAPESR